MFVQAKQYQLREYRERVQFLIDSYAESSAGGCPSPLSIVRYLKTDPDIAYVIAECGDSLLVWPDEKKFFTHLKSVPEGKFLKFNERVIQVLRITGRYSETGTYTFSAGLEAQNLFIIRNEARKRAIAYILVIFLLFYLVGFVFMRIAYRPLREITGRLHLLARGQNIKAQPVDYSAEIRQADADLELISRRITEMRQREEDRLHSLQEAITKAGDIRSELDLELKKMSELVLLSIRLNEAQGRDGVLQMLNTGLIEQMGFQISMVFSHENNQLRYHLGSVRGSDVLQNKIRDAFSGYVISSESNEYREITAGNTILTSQPRFQSLLETLNITAYFALAPIATKTNLLGMVAAGYLGTEKKVDDQALEKLKLLCNIAALNLENLRSLQSLSRSMQVRTDELQTANKLLAESIIERDNMLKLVSHDMNAPLRNVIGLVDSIFRKFGETLPEDVLDRITRIRTNVEKELQMIRDVLLNFRAFEAATSDEFIDVRETLMSIKEELQHELEKKSIDFYIPEKLPAIKAKRHLIRHIFLNLVDNASKYLPENRNGNRIWIDAKETIDEVTFSVSDNGKGIPQDKQLDIFLSYKSLEGVREMEFTGLGLGLALVKNIVEKISGKIWMKSKTGEGTTFFFSLRKGKYEHIARNRV